jgi:hypothetical protein
MLATTALGVVVSFVIGAPEWAAASCAGPVGIADAIKGADVVVVGTVTATRSRDRVATVAIDEVWKGTVGKTVEVHGGAAADNVMTSVDRTYTAGKRYLIFAFEPAIHGNTGSFGARYEDNNCSDTQRWSASLGRYRPTTATTKHRSAPTTPPAPRVAGIRPAPDRTTTPWLAVGVITGGVLIAAGIALAGLRRRRRPQSPISS